VTDRNPIVRNNSIRVLAVLAAHDPNIARQIPPDPFIPMLRSLDWTDRNKALFLLDPITAARDPKALESLRRQAPSLSARCPCGPIGATPPWRSPWLAVSLESPKTVSNRCSPPTTPPRSSLRWAPSEAPR